MKKLLTWFTRVTPLRIALAIAFLFVVFHVTVEVGAFEFGLLSRKGYLRTLDLKMLDTKFLSTNKEDVPHPQVVVAAIDEESIERFGRYPWSRNILADFINKVSSYQPAAIAFDVVFSDPDKNSSYVSVKKFLDAFETSELGPKSKAFRALAEQVENAKSEFEQARNRADALRAKMRIEQRHPQKAQYLKLITDAGSAATRAKAQLEKAQDALTDLERSRRAYRKSLQSELSTISPDQAFADAIGNAKNVVLGYFIFTDESEIEDIADEQLEQDRTVLVPSTIDGLYELDVEDRGGAVIERRYPADVDWANLQLREAVGFQSPLPIFGKKTDRFGFFNAHIDPDGQMRRLRLLHKSEEKIYPSLSLQAASLYFQNSEVFPENGSIRSGETLDGIWLGTHRFVTTDMQSKMLVNYYDNPQKYFPVCGIAAMLDGRCDALENGLQDLKGKVILVGATAIGTYDLRPTAFGAVPGVFLHATGIQNMIDGKFLERFAGIQLIEVLILLVSGLFLGLVLPRVPPLVSVLVTLTLIVGYYLVDVYLIFPRGLWLLNVFPTLQWAATLGAVVFHKYLTEGREKRQIRQAFQFYLTKSVVDEMLKDTTKLKLGGERRECTVLFSDIRGFTTISESLQPEELSALLNEYLTPMTNLVFKYDGTLDKYMGDAIMAIFGAPVPYEDHATRGCLVALDMMDELEKLKQKWTAEGSPHTMDIGIGLNTGPMSVGNMGSEVRFDYTVMGDQVNLGSRLESINKQYGTNIIISEHTYKKAAQDVHARELDLVRVKGKNEPVRIYELLGRGQAQGETLGLIGVFEDALQSYRAQRWDEAAETFRHVLQDLKPNDAASQLYLDRIAEVRTQTLSPTWDGVFTATSK